MSIKCKKCSVIVVDKSQKPFGDYFLCHCYGIKRNFSELDHWNDKICLECAIETKCCQTCGKKLTKFERKYKI